ncbi:MAG: Rieske (2Fe-2S) protein, partial [Burkholderiales bacterium]|nr:Rieske (2Fe-2S) protein [Burkholderiales bacterium]
MSRNSIEWKERPPFPQTHYVNTEIYTSEQIFREEQAKIFGKCWIIACHESELPGAYDFRTFNHPSGVPLIVIRGEDGAVRTFYNICPHRGNLLLYDPVGNAKRITCIFHAWSFNAKGDCIDISRAKQGYQDRYECKDAGLREVKTEIGYGGFVWVNIDDDSCSLKEYIGDALGLLEQNIDQPLEVFHYHKAVVTT